MTLLLNQDLNYYLNGIYQITRDEAQIARKETEDTALGGQCQRPMLGCDINMQMAPRLTTPAKFTSRRARFDVALMTL